MATRISKRDLELLRRIQEIGARGLTQDEIAAELGKTRNVLRYQLSEMGFRMANTVEVRTTLGGVRLDDLLERGELVEADDPEPAEEVAA